MVLMRNETFVREFILALPWPEVGLSSAGAAYLDCHRACSNNASEHIARPQTMHPLDQHTPTTDHIGKGSTNSGDALRCKSGQGAGGGK